IAAADLDAVERVAVGSLLHLVQAIQRTTATARLHVVTRSAQAVSSDPHIGISGVVQSPLWGFGRAISVEHPDQWGSVIDIDHASSEAAADALTARLDRADASNQSALRGGARSVARLEPAAVSDTPVLPIQSDAAYVVTGGLGLLGLEIARWLA